MYSLVTFFTIISFRCLLLNGELLKANYNFTKQSMSKFRFLMFSNKKKLFVKDCIIDLTHPLNCRNTKILLFNFIIDKIFWMWEISSKNTNTACELLLCLIAKLTFFYRYQKGSMMLIAHYSSKTQLGCLKFVHKQ